MKVWLSRIEKRKERRLCRPATARQPASRERLIPSSMMKKNNRTKPNQTSLIQNQNVFAFHGLKEESDLISVITTKEKQTPTVKADQLVYNRNRTSHPTQHQLSKEPIFTRVLHDKIVAFQSKTNTISGRKPTARVNTIDFLPPIYINTVRSRSAS